MDEDEVIDRHDLQISCEARRFRGLLPHEDLMQEGRVATLCAWRTFNAKRGTQFWSYAQRCVRNRYLTLLAKKAAEPIDAARVQHDDVEEQLALEAPPSPETLAALGELVDIVLRGLDDRDIEILEHFLAERPIPANTTYGAAYRRFQRLVQIMRKRAQ